MGQIKQFAIEAEEAGVDPGLALGYWKSGVTSDEAIAMAVKATPEDDREQNLADLRGETFLEQLGID